MSGPYPPDWHEEAFLIPGLDTGAISQDTVEELFQELDVDQKGYIAKADVRRLMAMFGAEMDETDVEEMMRLVDPEGKQTVTLEDLMYGILSPGPLFFNTDMPTPTSALKLPTKKDKLKLSKSRVVDEVEMEFNRASEERRQLYSDLLSGSRLPAPEIKKIFARFQEVDKRNKGTVTYPEFLQGMNLMDSPASRRLFDVLDRDGNGQVDMKEFIIGLSQFTDVSNEERVKFAFRIFDRDNSGFIDKDELMRIVRSTAPTWAQTSWLNRRVEKLYNSIGLTRDQQIDLATFLRLARENPSIIAPNLLTVATDPNLYSTTHGLPTVQPPLKSKNDYRFIGREVIKADLDGTVRPLAC